MTAVEIMYWFLGPVRMLTHQQKIDKAFLFQLILASSRARTTRLVERSSEVKLREKRWRNNSRSGDKCRWGDEGGAGEELGIRGQDP